jgi:O-acetyl-ADP-ribose deacetylase (regulator of RNase III)
MIRVVLSGPRGTKAEAILRSVSSDGQPDTPFSREMELALGSEVAGRLQAMGELPVGAAVITPGGDLGISFAIHVVVQGREDPVTSDRLRAALQNGLRRAHEWGIETLAVPVLGSGAGKMDAQDSANVMVPLIEETLRAERGLREVSILVGTPYEEEVFLDAVDAALRRLALPEN